MDAPTLQSIDEEDLVVPCTKIKAFASQPQGTKRFAAHMNIFVTELERDLEKHRPEIKQRSKVAYSRRVLKCVNMREPGGEDQVRHSKTGEVKVGGLSNTQAKNSNPGLSCFMFHRIYEMYRLVSRSFVAHFHK